MNVMLARITCIALLLGALAGGTGCKKTLTAPDAENDPSTRANPTPEATITWYLVRVSNPSADQLDAYDRITAAMNAAVAMYNQQTTYCSGNLRVEYNTSVPTADGNVNGTIRFGANRSYMNQRTAMHEIAHTQGVGTTARWTQLVVNGKYTGAYGLAMLRSFVGESPTATLNADGHSFWPYGLNYNSEWSTVNGQRHARLVGAFQRDGV
ncbi:hypothetical protein [Longitalea arenae]|uniref:hypothetical protein n=1 Tax=Longitalea arenae TaxID=2812558 RepID=UPI001967860D|nr:hypothetical protein [Longitalea arenae]